VAVRASLSAGRPAGHSIGSAEAVDSMSWVPLALAWP
jgi:hypothetical protein